MSKHNTIFSFFFSPGLFWLQLAEIILSVEQLFLFNMILLEKWKTDLAQTIFLFPLFFNCVATPKKNFFFFFHSNTNSAATNWINGLFLFEKAIQVNVFFPLLQKKNFSLDEDIEEPLCADPDSEVFA